MYISDGGVLHRSIMKKDPGHLAKRQFVSDTSVDTVDGQNPATHLEWVKT